MPVDACLKLPYISVCVCMCGGSITSWTGLCGWKKNCPITLIISSLVSTKDTPQKHSISVSITHRDVLQPLWVPCQLWFSGYIVPFLEGLEADNKRASAAGTALCRCTSNEWLAEPGTDTCDDIICLALGSADHFIAVHIVGS